ncbi:transglutaminaseTgpA domain-containing protein [Reinekea marinisedimentorum]|uniref:Transglutaminase superfamily protein n=1 Tax=Reinekea marinisedimentorum TaxID=230495 RepID=A0A4R3I6Y3_9GAMM|nr:DUF3488 and transglutaminase-like domain-containing protein [Reinekea marinisedimentorum]TCS41453.1 transglutaminase superfamily protein [Reinekea marinisedimentorum]
MSDQYLPPAKRVLHQRAFKALMVTQLMTVLAFLSYLPQWLLLAFCLVAFWRWRVMHGQFTAPPRTLVILSMILGIVGILVSGFTRYTLDAAVAFCMLGYLLKSLEVLRRRDGVVQVYLGYFLTGVYLLYRFDPLGALVAIVLLFLNTLALAAVTSDASYRLSYGIRQTSLLLLGAVPVMVAGYLFFPRLPPLWVIPNDQRGAVTGMSDELIPGSVASLAQSSDPAFRVAFDGELPPRDQWYWRGNTLSQFDGRVWRASYSERNRFSWPRNSNLPEPAANLYEYSIILPKTGRKWLYFLDWPVSANAENAVVLPDARLASIANINANIQYSAVSAAAVQWSAQDRFIAESLRLPAAGNEELRRWALDLRASVTNDTEYVQYLADYIRSQDFYYTLRPPLYDGADAMANFWLGGQRGFCEHYASAVTFILRSAGIPARMVGGYLGGVYNERGNYIQVRQMEAHVWVEVWLNNRWQRFDPTAAVAPDRIELNLDALLTGTSSSELPVFSRVQRLPLLSSLTMYWDSITYQWQVTVLNYNNETGVGWFEASFGEFSPLKVVLFVLAIMSLMGLIVGVLTGVIVLPKRKPEPYASISKIEKHFGQRLQGETISQYFVRLSAKNSQPSLFTAISQEIEKQLYSGQDIMPASRIRMLTKELVKEKKRKSTV